MIVVSTACSANAQSALVEPRLADSSAANASALTSFLQVGMHGQWWKSLGDKICQGLLEPLVTTRDLHARKLTKWCMSNNAPNKNEA